MVLICPKCEARLQLDEAKAPSHPFSVRCPKCQTSVNVQEPPASNLTAVSDDIVEIPATPTQTSPFERPITAPPFKVDGDKSNPPFRTQPTLPPPNLTPNNFSSHSHPTHTLPPTTRPP